MEAETVTPEQAGAGRCVSFLVPPIGSHVFSSMGLGRRMKMLGYDVEYWGDDKIRGMVEKEGFGFRLLAECWGMWSPELALPKNPFLHPIRMLNNVLLRRQWRTQLLATLTRHGAFIDALLNEKQPSLVIFDPFRLAYYPFLYRRGIPGVVLSTKPLASPDPDVPPHTSGLIPRAGFVGKQLVKLSWLWLRLVDLGNRLIELLARCLGAYTYNDLIVTAAQLSGFPLRSERVRRWLWYDVHFKSVPEWALWTADMDFPRRNPLSSNIRYVGPSVDFTRREDELEIRRRPQTRHLIYVAAGTAVAFAWKKELSLLSRIVQAFQADLEVEVWIATGDERLTAALGPPPPNVRLFPFLPQLKILDVADLTITHAGAGTLRECIMAEVPMLAYPRDFDQFGNAARIVYLNLGLRGDRTSDSPSSIRQKAFAILQDTRFRENLRILKAKIERCEGDLLASALEDVLPRQRQELMP